MLNVSMVISARQFRYSGLYRKKTIAHSFRKSTENARSEMGDQKRSQDGNAGWIKQNQKCMGVTGKVC